LIPEIESLMGVKHQNHHLHYLQVTSIHAVTATKGSLVLTQGRMIYLVLAQLSIPNHDSPLPGHVQELTTQMAHFDVFSHVVE
jgi:hypothetical protein